MRGRRHASVARSLIHFLIALSLAWPALAEPDAPTQPAEPHAPVLAPTVAPPGTAPPPAAAHPSEQIRASSAEQRRLPPDSTTRHSIKLPGRTLDFAATAGSVRLYDRGGKPQVDIAYIGYRLDGADAAARPVSFVLNGGPGMASAWLHLGALGPWRLPLGPDSFSPSAPLALVDNAETWLDFTDLVFIDPAGTGYSRFAGKDDEAQKRFWSVDGDIASLAQFVRRWLEANNRLSSPKFFVGESYGAFRGPKLVRDLESEQGIGIGGMVLLSPTFDIEMLTDDEDPLWWVARLPSMVAAARALQGPVTPASLADAEAYAAGDFLQDFLRGRRDAAAVARMSARVAELTGLDPELVRQNAGRVSTGTFLRNFYRPQGRVGSPYDATVTMVNPAPGSEWSRYPDPVLQGMSAPLTSAMLDLYAHRLAWRPEGRYRLSNLTANEEWDWGRGMETPESLSGLRNALALDSRLRVLIAQGMTDLVTPYFGTKMLLDQLPDFGPDRVRFAVYAGGHMFYLRDASRAALRDAAQALMGTR